MAGEINFGLLQTPDFVGNALSGFEAGRRLRSARNKRNALAMYGTDPQGAINALRTEDPEMAFNLEDRQQKQADRATKIRGAQAYAGGDMEGARTAFADAGDIDAIQGLDEQKRAAASKAAQDLATVAMSLKGQPYEARRQTLSDPQLQQFLADHGLPPDRVANFDPSDQALDVFINDAMTFKERLEQSNKDREFGLKKADSEADNSRADQKLSWDMKHGDRMAGIAAQNAGTSAYSAKTGRMSYEARKAAGGFGTPGNGAGQWEEF